MPLFPVPVGSLVPIPVMQIIPCTNRRNRPVFPEFSRTDTGPFPEGFSIIAGTVKACGKGDFCYGKRSFPQKIAAFGKTVIVEIIVGRLGKISGKKPAAFTDSHRTGSGDLFQRNFDGIIFLDKICHISDRRKIIVNMCFCAGGRNIFIKHCPDAGERRQDLQRCCFIFPMFEKKTDLIQNLLLPGDFWREKDKRSFVVSDDRKDEALFVCR